MEGTPAAFIQGVVVEDGPQGRRAIARVPLRAGAVVLREPAASAVLRRERWASHCFSCWSRLPSANPARCSRCKCARFCGVVCQRDDWRRVHRAECGALAALADAADSEEGATGFAGLAEDALLLGRLLRAYAAMDPIDRAALDAQCSSPPARLAQSRRVVETAHRFGLLLGASDDPALALAHRLSAAFDANNFGAIEPIGSSVLAAASFPRSAILNHSCAPTCSIAHALLRPSAGGGVRLVQEIRALTDLLAGTELTHAYVDTGLGATARRALLSRGWGFDCTCARCVAFDAGDEGERQLDVPLQPGADGDLIEAASLHAQALASDEPARERELLRRALALRERHLIPAHAHVREARAALLALELADGHLAQAKAQACALVEGARAAYGGRPCASFAILLLTAAELLHASGGADGGDGEGAGGAGSARARAFVSEALGILIITNGADHPLVSRARACAGAASV
jgi:SET and MYND domain-containing protein